MGYICLTHDKLKSSVQLQTAYDHNMRIRFCENADPARRELNKQLIQRSGTYEEMFENRLRDIRAKGYNKTLRHDAVKALDFCIAVGGDEVNDNPYFDLDRFCELAKQWTIDTFGEENIAGMTLHMDEHSPHIHVVIIPITKDDRLSAKDFTGTPEKLSKLQDSIASVMSPLGLKRGMKKSVAHHRTMKRFYSAVNEARADSLPEPIKGESAKEYKARAEEVVKDIKSRALNDSLKTQRKLEEALTEVRQLNSSSDIKTLIKENESLKKELNDAFQTIKKNEKSLYDWGCVVRAIKSNRLEEKKKKQLLSLLAEAASKGKDENIDEQTKKR